MGYGYEPDGSVEVVVFNADRRRSNCFPVGWVRPAPGGFLSSTTFEAPQEYEEWATHASADDAVSWLFEQKILALTGAGGEERDEDVGKMRSLKRASSLLSENLPFVKKALIASASSLVTESVKNMLRVSSHEEVMAAVNLAMVSEVLES